MGAKYFGSWNDHKSCGAAWMHYGSKQEAPDGFPSDEQILFASYGGAAYEGDAVVIFERDGQLFENSGGHCSCNGLEGQWDPEATTWAALAMRDRDGRWPYLSDHDSEARAAYWALVDAHTPSVADAAPGDRS